MLTTTVGAASARRLFPSAIAGGRRSGHRVIGGHLNLNLRRRTTITREESSSSPGVAYSFSSACSSRPRQERRPRQCGRSGRRADGRKGGVDDAIGSTRFTSTVVVVVDLPSALGGQRQLAQPKRSTTERFVHRRRSFSSGTSIVVDHRGGDDEYDTPPPPLPPRFLRDSDPANFDGRTHQRDSSTLHFDLQSGKPLPPPPPPTATGDEEEDPRYRIEGCRVVSGGEGGAADGAGDEGAEDLLVVKWGDGVESRYPMDSVENWVDVWRGGGGGGGGGPYRKEKVGWGRARSKEAPSFSGDDRFTLDRRGRALWRNLTESDVRGATTGPGPVISLPFHDAMHDVNGSNRSALEALYRYGILLVTDTPVVTSDKEEAAAAIAAFASSVGGGTVKSNPDTSLLPRYLSRKHDDDDHGRNEPDHHPVVVLPHGTDGPQRTLYGGVWYTTTAPQVSGTSVADSAYGSDGLPLHTDLTYYRDPAGLQLFAMIAPASSGGESVFADGFAVAEELRKTDEEAFRTLCLAERRYRCVDDVTGWHLQARGSVIETSEPDGEGEILSIRHNDLDRLPDLPPRWMCDDEMGAVEEYYERLDGAHEAWDGLLGRDEFRLVMSLGPGDMVVVANRRVMHGRCSFVTGVDEPRSVIGCYVSQDELESRFRVEGFLID